MYTCAHILAFLVAYFIQQIDIVLSYLHFLEMISKKSVVWYDCTVTTQLSCKEYSHTKSSFVYRPNFLCSSYTITLHNGYFNKKRGIKHHIKSYCMTLIPVDSKFSFNLHIGIDIQSFFQLEIHYTLRCQINEQGKIKEQGGYFEQIS